MHLEYDLYTERERERDSSTVLRILLQSLTIGKCSHFNSLVDRVSGA